MKEQNRRRPFLKKLGISLASLPVSFSGFAAVFSGNKKENIFMDREEITFRDYFAKTNDRVWIGEDYWAIPMEDWRVKQGRIEFTGNEKYSRMNVLTTLIQEGQGEITISADLGLLKKNSNNKGGMAGFSIGVKDELDPDVKAACYFGKGINVGISTKGHLFIADQTLPLSKNFDYSAFSLKVKSKTINNSTQLILMCDGKDSSKTEITYQTNEDISGLIALVNNFDQAGGDTFWFRNFKISGSKIKSKPENGFGPILWSMYTLSKKVLKISAQMPPLSVKDNQKVKLYFKKNSAWELASSQNINEAASIAHFTMDNWDSGKEVPYQLVYRNNGKKYTYDGTIRKEPIDRPLRFGGLTCQHASAYPYSPLVKNLKKHDPDLIYFSGDQIYESNGGYPIKRQPEPDAILSYLGKWYMFGWTFGDIMRDRPTICTPDDHDAFQGNLWGEGGKRISFEEWEKVSGSHGGYVQTPKWVNVVAETQCGHMPAPFHQEPLHSGVKAWYTDLLYGKVSFAVISDRMFKSGPALVRQNYERPDHIKEPLSEKQLEDPNLKLLGNRQMQFLEHWINDWQGADMKVLLSQTLFANVTTHHGPDKMFLYGDMDSGGWPKQKRDDTLRLLRKAFVFHINGDQHLPFLVQYSLNEKQDSGWTFCTPAISAGYPRWGQPDSINMLYTDRPTHNLPNTGCYQDVFGNLNYIYAVGNPEDKFSTKNRYAKAQSKASGFGIITFNTNERMINMEAYRFLADKDRPTESDQFPGWPLTISQTDNDGRKPIAYLPRLEMNEPAQVIKVISENNNELVNILRIKGSTYQPGVYQEDTYTIQVGEGQKIKEFKGIKPVNKSSKAIIQVKV